MEALLLKSAEILKETNSSTPIENELDKSTNPRSSLDTTLLMANSEIKIDPLKHSNLCTRRIESYLQPSISNFYFQDNILDSLSLTSLNESNMKLSENGANYEGLGPESVDYVTQRLKKFEFEPLLNTLNEKKIVHRDDSIQAEIELEMSKSPLNYVHHEIEHIQIHENNALILSTELLPEEPPTFSTSIPSIEQKELQTSVKEFVSEAKKHFGVCQKEFTSHLLESTTSNKVQQYSKGLSSAENANAIYEPGKMIMRLQSVELQPIEQIPSSKPIEGGRIIVLFSYANQTIDVISNQITSSAALTLFDQIDSEFDASDNGASRFSVSVFFQDQDSGRSKKSKGFRSLVHNLMTKKKTSNGTIYPVPSNLSMLSTVTTKNSEKNCTFSEILIGKSEIEIRTKKFSELFAGKLLEMEIRFEENQWIKSLKIACCFLQNTDLTRCGYAKCIPRNLVEGAEFIEIRNVIQSVHFHGLVSVKKSNELIWKTRICKMEALNLEFFDKCGNSVGSPIDLSRTSHILEQNDEALGQIPKQFRICFCDDGDLSFIEIITKNCSDYKVMTKQLKLLCKILSLRKFK